MLALLGLQKYFTIGLAALFLVSAGAAVTYRASYQMEQAQRIEAEASLRRTTAAFEEFTKNSAKALDAVNRAAAVSASLADQRRTQREKIIQAPNDQDGPVAPILRDAVRGVR